MYVCEVSCRSEKNNSLNLKSLCLDVCAVKSLFQISFIEREHIYPFVHSGFVFINSKKINEHSTGRRRIIYVFYTFEFECNILKK